MRRTLANHKRNEMFLRQKIRWDHCWNFTFRIEILLTFLKAFVLHTEKWFYEKIFLKILQQKWFFLTNFKKDYQPYVRQQNTVNSFGCIVSTKNVTTFRNNIITDNSHKIMLNYHRCSAIDMYDTNAADISTIEIHSCGTIHIKKCQ